MDRDLRLRARRRALRAASVVTIAVAMGGCSERTPGAPQDAGGQPQDAYVASDTGVMTDAAVEMDAAMPVDAYVPTDAGSPVDAGVDGGVVADAGIDAGLPLLDAGHDAGIDDCLSMPIPVTRECCDRVGGFWDGERCLTITPGPFVPPALA